MDENLKKVDLSKNKKEKVVVVKEELPIEEKKTEMEEIKKGPEKPKAKKIFKKVKSSTVRKVDSLETEEQTAIKDVEHALEQIPLNNSLDEDIKLSVLIAGSSGSGKTTLVADVIRKVHHDTLPIKLQKAYNALGKVLFLDTEGGGLIRLRRMCQKQGLDSRYVTYKRINNITDLNREYKYLLAHPKEYRTIIVDSLQELQRQGIIKFSQGSDLNPSMLTDFKKMQIQHYNESQNQMIAVLLLLQKLNINTLYTCIDFLDNEKAKDKTAVYSLVVPHKQGKILPSIPDIVGHIEVGLSGKRIFKTKQTSVYPFVKDRTDLLNPKGNVLEGSHFLASLLAELN